MKLARCRSEFYVTVETRLGVLSVEVLVEEHWLECLSLDQVFARLLLVVLGSIFYPYACCWLPLLSHWYTPNWNIITLPGPGPVPQFGRNPGHVVRVCTSCSVAFPIPADNFPYKFAHACDSVGLDRGRNMPAPPRHVHRRDKVLISESATRLML